jgi:hypothetical protein
VRGEVIEPFREWRLTVSDNAQNLTLDLRWHDTKRAVFHRMGGAGMHTSENGRPALPTAGYEGFGRIEGDVTVRGSTLSLSDEQHHGEPRSSLGRPQRRRRPGHLQPQPAGRTSDNGSSSPTGPFGGGGACATSVTTEHPGAEMVSPVSNRMRFDPETRHLIGGVIQNRFPDGTVREITYEQIGNRVAYLRCGMYMGPDQNGTPEENWFQGTHGGGPMVAG